MLTMFAALAPRRRFCQGAGMTTRNTTGGGLFLMLGIVIGTIIGVVIKLPMEGVLIGTGVGIVLAVVAWVIDWRKGSGDAPRRPDNAPDTVD